MKRILVIFFVILVTFLIGFGAGGVYYGFVKVNPAVKESLEKRTVAHLKAEGYEEGQYKMKIVKGLKFDGMKDYSADVEFLDEPGHHYSYSEDNEGKLVQEGWNGKKHIESSSK